MGTTFKARDGGRARVAQESVGPLEAFLIRLRGLGATEDELHGVREAWNEPDGWVMPKAQLVALADSQLVSMIGDARREYELHTLTDEEVAERAIAGAAAQQAVASADYAALVEQMGQLKVAEVRGWVGTDPHRALAALTTEQAAPEPRKTLVAFLEQLLVED